MKVFLLILFLVATTSNLQQTASSFNVNIFTNVPKDMEGCGENYFLNKKDEKNEKFICYTDYDEALICVNNQIVKLKYQTGYKKQRVFSNKNYILLINIISKKNTGDENYDIPQATIIIKYNSKTIWSKKVIGGGGC